jgi:formate C-acetyltransferase
VAGAWSSTSLNAYGYEPDPTLAEVFTKHRKTHNDGVFDVYTPEIRKARSAHLVTGLPGRLRAGPHHRRLPPRRALRRSIA